ncbi:hypothetical protein BJ980_001679 [Nocardioides daedukensis]|uniref:Integrase catalytic domain-containing protein n=1 Tax=Nocardioides daedukensis TaxID=634462 RepID=A0A7Y9S077_9ACTN|nr:hypothetical protein [Nocardioides daedukensis]
MRAEGPIACQPRPFRVTTEADEAAAKDMPDLVGRDFTAERPGARFVGDITYIHTWAGFIYLATVIDCYSKKVVGWSIADQMRTELVTTALRNAAATSVIEPGAVFHSDRGSVYTSAEYRTLVTDLGMHSSMGRTGVCWDNAMSESFFSALKNEHVYRIVYATKAQARRDVIAYIEGFYNSRRRHSALGYKRPNEVHYGYTQPETAAYESHQSAVRNHRSSPEWESMSMLVRFRCGVPGLRLNDWVSRCRRVTRPSRGLGATSDRGCPDRSCDRLRTFSRPTGPTSDLVRSRSTRVSK